MYLYSVMTRIDLRNKSARSNFPFFFLLQK